MDIFENASLGNVRLKNRIIRSATFEGAADRDGFPTAAYYRIFKKLAEGGVGAVITGFTYISENGKAMQPGQAGSDSMEKLESYQVIAGMMHQYDCKVFLQIAHAGRQTLRSATGFQPVGASEKKSAYFQEKPHVLTSEETYAIIDAFGNAALLAQKAGLDGVQLHAAHGYLIHQFLQPAVNDRTDEFAPDLLTGVGTVFLQKVIEAVRRKCGPDFPVLVKISASDDLKPHFSEEQFLNLVQFLDRMQVDGIEISYGTMDAAFNIFRGDIPEKLILRENGIYKHKSQLVKWFARRFVFPRLKKQFIPFQPMYNLPFAEMARRVTHLPIIVVGGFRDGRQIRHAICDCGIDFVSLSRPLIAEPDFVNKLNEDLDYTSACVSCNRCAIMCDSSHPTRCYHHSRVASPTRKTGIMN